MSSLLCKSFQLFCFLIFLMSTKAQANTNALVQLETACYITTNAYLLMAPHLETEDAAIYANDLEFIKKFPFSSYDLISVPQQGVFYINDLDDTIKNSLRKKRCWESTNKQHIKIHAKPGSIALDIGAHIGTHTVTMSKCVGEDGIVLAFEPSRTIHRELVYNLVANNCRNTYPIRSAIGKNKNIVDIVSSHPQNEGGSYVVKAQGGVNTAVQLPLDIFNLNNVSFIKIDVENMEADVLDGAELTILRNRPVILIEIQGNNERPIQLGEDTKAMALITIEKIKKLGYKLKSIKNSAEYLAFPE